MFRYRFRYIDSNVWKMFQKMYILNTDTYPSNVTQYKTGKIY